MTTALERHLGRLRPSGSLCKKRWRPGIPNVWIWASRLSSGVANVARVLAPAPPAIMFKNARFLNASLPNGIREANLFAFACLPIHAFREASLAFPCTLVLALAYCALLLLWVRRVLDGQSRGFSLETATLLSSAWTFLFSASAFLAFLT